jgi:NAD(P)-dependent dehydrogenase (short-subunit alcohol dehydrogenase family)
MCERGFGRIVFISSVAAFTGGLVGAHYAASKAGLHGLSHILSQQGARHGVTANVVAPALIEGDMIPDDRELRSSSEPHGPVGRLGKREGVADLVAAIVRNGYLTNQSILIDGGGHPTQRAAQARSLTGSPIDSPATDCGAQGAGPRSQGSRRQWLQASSVVNGGASGNHERGDCCSSRQSRWPPSQCRRSAMKLVVPRTAGGKDRLAAWLGLEQPIQREGKYLASASWRQALCVGAGDGGSEALDRGGELIVWHATAEGVPKHPIQEVVEVFDKLRHDVGLARLLLHRRPKRVDRRELVGPPEDSLHHVRLTAGLARCDALHDVPQSGDKQLGSGGEVPIDRVLSESEVASDPDHRQRVETALVQAPLSSRQDLGHLVFAVELRSCAGHSLTCSQQGGRLPLENVTRIIAAGPDVERKLLLLGATGLTGQQLLAQAIEQGHDITALVRNPSKLTVERARVRIVIGDATDAAAVDDALENRDAVLCALGTRSPKSMFRCDLTTSSMRALVPSMKRRGVDRVIVESALGVGPSATHAPPAVRLAFATLLRQVGKDKTAAEEYLRASGLDWTIVYPPSLTNGPVSDHYRSGKALQLRGVPKISRASVAHFMVSQLSDTTYSRGTAIVSD